MTKLIHPLLLILCLPLAGADKEKPLPKDFKSLTALAEKGDARAQSSLGGMYRDGRGVEKDFKEALKWFRKSAEQENSDAQNNLGDMYHRGQGAVKNDKEAVKWFRKSAEQNNSFGQNNLGVMDWVWRRMTRKHSSGIPRLPSRVTGEPKTVLDGYIRLVKE